MQLDDIELSNFNSATLRWHLEDAEWLLNKNVLLSNDIKITVEASNNVFVRLNKGWNSLYYSNKKKVTILEIISDSFPSEIRTEVELLYP